MAILGYNTKGASTSTLSAGRMYVSKFTLASAATLTELHGWFSGGSSYTVRVVIYADTAGLPGARVAYTNPISVTGSDADLSQTGFSVALAAGDYWIGFYTSAGNQFVYCESTGGTHQGIISGAADPPADPFPTPTTSGTRKHSCWAVVTTGAASTFVPRIMAVT